LQTSSNHDSIENIAGTDAIPAAKQRIYNHNIQNLPLFMLPVNLWAFWWKPHDSTADGCKMTTD